ncbi:hypothetical protein C1T15_28510, partial [Escherichia coli]
HPVLRQRKQIFKAGAAAQCKFQPQRRDAANSTLVAARAALTSRRRVGAGTATSRSFDSQDGMVSGALSR